MDKQQLEWLQCVCDYSDGVKGYGGYVTAGPGLRAVDQSLRELGYVVGVPTGALASAVTDTGRAALAACASSDHPAASGVDVLMPGASQRSHASLVPAERTWNRPE